MKEHTLNHIRGPQYQFDNLRYPDLPKALNSGRFLKSYWDSKLGSFRASRGSGHTAPQHHTIHGVACGTARPAQHGVRGASVSRQRSLPTLTALDSLRNFQPPGKEVEVSLNSKPSLPKLALQHTLLAGRRTCTLGLASPSDSNGLGLGMLGDCSFSKSLQFKMWLKSTAAVGPLSGSS